MLRMIYSMKGLDLGQLMTVYTESNRENGKTFYPYLSANEQLLQVEQDLFSYIREFFRNDQTFYAVWAPEGRYAAALRMEPYLDGLLLEALETAPEARGKGYATALVEAVIAKLREHGSIPVYAHVSKKNPASLKVHRNCGFEIVKDHAAFVDGSVSNDTCTLCYGK